MNVSVAPKSIDKTRAKTLIVDCDIHPTLKSPNDIRSRLPRRWQDHFDEYGSYLRQAFTGTQIYLRMQPMTSREDAWPPNGGVPGSDLDFMRAQHLDANNIEYGILQPITPAGFDQRNLGYGAAMCSAINDWQAECWLDHEPRLRGNITVAQEDPATAIKEIERCASDRRFVQVTFGALALEPVGRSRYWPIFEMAERAGLPVAFHTGGVNGLPPSGVGWVSHYFEHHFSQVPAQASQLVSLVLEGVFEKFPKLRVVMVEGGFGWVPSLCWRLDQHWERLKSEVPHLTKPPSHYIKEQVWFTTQPVEEPTRPGDLRRLLEQVGYDRLLFSTDYPHHDSDDPNYAFRTKLSDEEKQMIFRTNAINLYRLQS